MMETSVLFVDVLRSKVFCCWNASLEERTEGVFIYGIPVNIQNAISMF